MYKTFFSNLIERPITPLTLKLEYQEKRLRVAESMDDVLYQDSEKRPNSAAELGNFSYYHAMNDQADAAIETALKALALDPSQKWAKTNLALGYLLKGEEKLAAALEIYRELQTEEYRDEGYPYQEVFQQDLAELEKNGISHPNIAAARNHLWHK